MNLGDYIQIGILIAIAFQGYYTWRQFKHLREQFNFEQIRFKKTFLPVLKIDVNFIDSSIHYVDEIMQGEDYYKIVITCNKASAFNVKLKALPNFSTGDYSFERGAEPTVLNPGDNWEFKLKGPKLISQSDVAEITFSDIFGNQYNQVWSYATYFENNTEHQLKSPQEVKIVV